MRTTFSLLFLALIAAPLAGQEAGDLVHACYVPSSGVVYRIKAADSPDRCRSRQHVEFS